MVKNGTRTLENFKSFITESKEDKYRIVVLSVEHGDNSITSKRIKEEAEKLDLPSYVIGIDGSYILYDNGSYKIYELDDEQISAIKQKLYKGGRDGRN